MASSANAGAALRTSEPRAIRTPLARGLATASAVLLPCLLHEGHVDGLGEVDRRALYAGVERLEVAIDGFAHRSSDDAVVLEPLEILFQGRFVQRLVGVVLGRHGGDD